MIRFAHRGFSSKYPENTFLAFKEAIKLQCDGIELDIHKTKDNKIVVIHDEDIKRTFIGEGLVKDYTLDELKQFRCKKKGFEHNDECLIPTLEEVLALFKDNKVILNIELKTDIIQYKKIEKDTIDLVYKYNMEKRVILSSFNHESIKIVKTIDSSLPTAALYSKRIKNVVNYAKSIEADAINPTVWLVSRKLVKKAHLQGLKVNVFTVNNTFILKWLSKIGVDGVFSDDTEKIMKLKL